jgi:ketosteroid isomerase-like protein
MTIRPLLALSLATLLAACASTRPTAAPGAPKRPPVPVDLAQLEAFAADQDFSEATAGHDARAFASFLARDAVFVNDGGVSAGLAAVCNDWAPLLQPGGPTLSWKPTSSLGSLGGDVVVTQGTWDLQPASGGLRRTGRYVTVWEREPDGKLRVALDASDAPLPPESARAARRPLKHVLSEDERIGAVAGLLLDGSREAGGFLVVEVREGDAWRVLVEVGSWRPASP